ncbi:hypothetical protein FDG2_6480 [Candidatus Protofrankia californiensis]|uniref:non-specific serine/threonine protein kinase n=1 Tax=Candidatus Protofrankia californiensis TaxID=1839754 RepID=A0A1C3PH58_9ACTN|nr:hypothetical protein FDG2_6480 [Candidatus Protofrankia californiensis]
METALPGYQVEGELGRGGYGLVLGGRHRLIGRNVAIKVLLDTAGDADLRARFLSEARVLAELDHPHVVRIHDYIEHQGTCLLVMELLPGGTLRQRLATGPVPAEATCALGLAAAAALDAAHSHNVLHRDIKPDNMMFASDGLLKVTDFGVAKIFEGTETTASGVLGTPRYMAPEQITGGRLYASTDLYALGGVLYELLAQRPLFGRALSVGALVNHHLNVTPLPLEGIPSAVNAVIMRTLAKEPAARFVSATEFALELARAATSAFGPNWLTRSGVKVRLDDEVRHIALGQPSGPNARVQGSPASQPRQPQQPQPQQARIPASGPQPPQPWPAGAQPQPGWSGPQPPQAYQPPRGLSHDSPADPSPRADHWVPPSAYTPPTRQVGGHTPPHNNFEPMAQGARAAYPPPGRPGTDWWQANPFVPGAGQGSGPSGPQGVQLPGPAQPPQGPGPGWPNERRRSSRRVWLIAGVAFTAIVTLIIGITLLGTRGGDSPPPPHSALFLPGIAYSGAALSLPELDAYDITIDRAGGLYVTDWTSNRVRKIQPDGTVVTVAGTGTAGFTGDGGPAYQAELSSPATTAVDSDGNVYVSDSSNQRIRKIDAIGTITTIAGTGTAGFTGDGGPATQAQINEPNGLALAADGSIYIADYGNQRIRKITPDGMIWTIAGNGTKGFSGDGGPATAAQINNPNSMAVAADGTLYVSDLGNGRIRKIMTNGVITTAAGNGTYGYAGDGGPAIQAELRIPSVAISPDGVLYIADYGNQRIRRVTADGVIATVAGNGTVGSAGDGTAATLAQLSSPTGTAVDGAGNLYIADDKNDRIRRVSPKGIITTVARVQ